MITEDQLYKITILIEQQFTQLPLQLSLIVFDLTDDRTGNINRISCDEACKLIYYLETCNPSERMRNKIFSLADEASIIRNLATANWQLNRFLLKYGVVKKELCSLNKDELLRVVMQFQKIIKHKQHKEAIHATKLLLENLQLPVQGKKYTA